MSEGGEKRPFQGQRKKEKPLQGRARALERRRDIGFNAKKKTTKGNNALHPPATKRALQEGVD